MPEVREGCEDRLDYCYQYGLMCDKDEHGTYEYFCPRSCGYCRKPTDAEPRGCADRWPHCAMDAWKGWCGMDESDTDYGNYGRFMKTNCARTCGFCGDSKQ